MLSTEIVAAVWAKGQRVDEANEQKGFRKDQCNAWIQRDSYGNRNSSWGWEVDHITPASQGGTDALSNLRPLHWENNAAKAGGRLECVVTSNGTQNVRIR